MLIAQLVLDLMQVIKCNILNWVYIMMNLGFKSHGSKVKEKTTMTVEVIC